MPEPGIGYTPFLNTSVSNVPVVVTTYPTRVFWVHAINPNATDVFIQIFDKQSSEVVVGTTIPVQSWIVPGGTGLINRGAFEEILSWPLQLNTALTIAVTTAPTNATPPANAAIVNLGYK